MHTYIDIQNNIREKYIHTYYMQGSVDFSFFLYSSSFPLLKSAFAAAFVVFSQIQCQLKVDAGNIPRKRLRRKSSERTEVAAQTDS